jgi:serine O-acetyltransferase
MNKILKDDLYRYVGDKSNSIITRWRYILFTPGYQYIYFFRKANLASNIVTKVFWNILLKLCSFKFGIQIPAQTQIAKGFRIVHFGTIVVNPGTIIGKNFNISQGCLIGNAQGKRHGTPIIGDNVCMNANSLIIGGVHIGNNVLIAPGAFVNFDVPDNSIVIGNPGQIIPRSSSPTAKYIVYSV